MKSYRSYITALTTMVLLVGAVFATSYQGDRASALDAEQNVNASKGIIESRVIDEARIKHNINEPLSISDVEPSTDNGPTRSCDDCEFDWTDYGAECCDAAFDDFGISCADLEANYGWDCAGCLCPGDVPCEDQGLVTCDFDGSCAASVADCPGACEDTGDFVDDCSGDGDCCPLSWIGDGFEDCEDQQYGCDLTCYDDDGGDCGPVVSCEDQGLVTCSDGSCAASQADCPVAGECDPNTEVEDCADDDCCPMSWIGDGFADCEDQAYGCDLTCYDNDGGDCVDPFCGDGACNGGETEATCPEDCQSSADCSACDLDWSAYGSECCDTAWVEFGIDCATLEGTYGWDCAGCSCPGDGPPCEGFVCWDGSCVDSEDDCPDIGDTMVVDCEGNVFDNTDPVYSGDGDSDGDGCMDTVYDCIVDNGTCEDVAGECLDANGACTGVFDCPDGEIGAWTNDTLCDDGDYGLWANCEEMCFDGGACGTMPEPDCTIGDGSNCESAGTGDVNADGAANVLDIVQIVNYILGSVEFDDCQLESADLNGDGAANVLDIVAIVNVILDGRSVDASSARLINEAGIVSIDADGFVGAVQMTLTHGADFSINLTDDAMVAEYATKGNTTTLVVVAPEDDQLFTSNGKFEITEMIVANSSVEINVVMATEFSLMAAYPNPFNPSTTLSLNMPEDGFVSVKVFNLMGKTVATLAEGNMEKNTYSFTWNASDMPSGMYMVRAEALGHVSSQKLMLLK